MSSAVPIGPLTDDLWNLDICLLCLWGENEAFLETLPQALYPNPRLPDHCPSFRWPKMKFPKDSDHATLLRSLPPPANIRAVVYLPSWTVIELHLEYDQCNMWALYITK